MLRGPNMGASCRGAGLTSLAAITSWCLLVFCRPHTTLPPMRSLPAAAPKSVCACVHACDERQRRRSSRRVPTTSLARTATSVLPNSATKLPSQLVAQ